MQRREGAVLSGSRYSGYGLEASIIAGRVNRAGTCASFHVGVTLSQPRLC